MEFDVVLTYVMNRNELPNDSNKFRDKLNISSKQQTQKQFYESRKRKVDYVYKTRTMIRRIRIYDPLKQFPQC